MAKSANAADRHLLWVWGQGIEFFPVSTTVALTDDFQGHPGPPVLAQKSQIVLHCTVANNSGEATINGWNAEVRPASAHFIVERTTTAQAARPALAAGSDRNDTGFVDVVRAIAERAITFHGGFVNANSIGIEHANVANAWEIPSTAHEPTLQGRHSPVATCPSPTNVGTPTAPRLVCRHGRPQDHNRWISLARPDPFAPAPAGAHDDFQAYEDQQYATMILLLRHLCITHRIPRQFLGNNVEEVYAKWEFVVQKPGESAAAFQARERLLRAEVRRFRGIFHHRNVHKGKECPGIVHRNRLYRGLIDEWWMPVEIAGEDRPYYLGPFEMPPFAAGSPTRPGFFFFDRGLRRLVGVTFHDADLQRMTESRSYFNLNDVARYYDACETREGGHFPIGVNRIWHDGVHLAVAPENPCVYAAAGGLIVAARVSSNPTTDADSRFGSQRFVLVRHAVHVATVADPDGMGQQIDYAAQPLFAFTLYMSLAPLADPTAEHDQNPPWFNIWRRHHSDDVGMNGDKGKVFAPNIEVSVGDLIGFAGQLRRGRAIHFQVMTHRDHPLDRAPYDDAKMAFQDVDDNAMCNIPALDAIVRDRLGEGLDEIDTLAAAPRLRNARVLHKSEWSIDKESQLQSVEPNAARRKRLFEHISRFAWVADAVALVPKLKDQLCDAKGIMWHYHPITFMQVVNQLIIAENRELHENQDHQTNVEIDEDGFVIAFVDFDAATHAYRRVPADAHHVFTHDVAAAGGALDFERRALACRRTGAHNPAVPVPLTTRFAALLLELLHLIRRHFNAAIAIDVAHVCSAHANAVTACALRNLGSVGEHRDGLAVDFAPQAPTPASCTALWQSTQAIVAHFRALGASACGSPTQALIPVGFNDLFVQAAPASAHAALTATPPVPVAAADAASFRIHLSLVSPAHPVPRPDAAPLTVRLRVTVAQIFVIDSGDLIGSGEWNVKFKVNGKLIQSTKETSVGDDQRLPGPPWSTEVELDSNAHERLSVEVSAIEVDDLSADDDMGAVQLRADQSSSPPWKIGTQQLRSPTGAYTVTLVIESLGGEIGI